MNIRAHIQDSLPLPDFSDLSDDDLLNPRAVMGDNMPPLEALRRPAVIEQAITAAPSVLMAVQNARRQYVFVAEFLKETPVIETTEHALQAANFIETTRRTVADMDAERRTRVDPLNVEVKSINDEYRLPKSSIESLLDEIKRRLKTYTDAEEARRQAEAERLAAIAAAAEVAAREAEAAENEARREADCGVMVDVAGATVEADKAFTIFLKKDRAAARAERNTKARFNGGFGRAISMRKTTVLQCENIADACAAITAMGLTDHVRDAIFTSARAYYQLHGEYPPGVTAEHERKF